jgi:hypothetical protein
VSAETRIAVRATRGAALRSLSWVSSAVHPGISDAAFNRAYAQALAALARWDEAAAQDRGERIR